MIDEVDTFFFRLSEILFTSEP